MLPPLTNQRDLGPFISRRKRSDLSKGCGEVAGDREPRPRVVKSIDDAVPAIIAAVDVGKRIGVDVDIFKCAGSCNGLGNTVRDPVIICLL